MAVIYLRHPIHGEKVASSDLEATYDQENGWVIFDPAGSAEPAPETPVVTPEVPSGTSTPDPVVPAFLAPTTPPATEPVESDLPEDFPGRAALIAAGFATWASVADLDRNELIALKGIGEKTADAILEVMDS